MCISRTDLEVVDGLEAVDAWHLAVLQPQHARLEVLARVPGILPQQQEVGLQGAAENIWCKKKYLEWQT